MKTVNTITWKWKRKHNSFLEGRCNDKKFGSVVMKRRYLNNSEKYALYFCDILDWVDVYKAYFKGKSLGTFDDMNSAKDAIISELEKVKK